mmetsp:Transcript_26225/g.26125  ORF Transcript_26225/g.26125 Transcript_26225/m.26125 type:complete len:172 (-) Transcript_26225:68-583(-)
MGQVPELNMTKSTLDNGEVTSPHRSSKPHYIYIIPDGVNIIKDKYKIFKADIQPYLNSLLPKRVKKKFEHRKKKEPKKEKQPLSDMIKQQVFKQFLTDVTAEMRSRREIVALFDTRGKPIQDLMQIKQDVKVFISSTDEIFRGVQGIHALETDEYRVDESKEKTKKAFLKA